MNIFADECVFGPTIKFLRDKGHDVVTVHDFALNGHEDTEILAFATAYHRILLTIDLDFGNIRHYPPEHHGGVIILRVRPSTLGQVHIVLAEFLQMTVPETLENTLVVIDHNKIRVRRK
jgi:predicted nuclease of predicted toxin-antitoxin system